jgi:hypothetical protein
MAEPKSVGQELLNVPFGEMIKEMGLAIAEAQFALDMNSIQVAQALAETKLEAGSVIIAIEETVDEEGNVTASNIVTNPNEMSLLSYGLTPTFYQFSESKIEVKMAITMRRERSVERSFGKEFKFENRTELNASYSTSGLASILFGKSSAKIKNTTTVAYTSTYNAKYRGKYSFEEAGSSLLSTVLRPVPPPARLIPQIKVKETA